MKNYKLLKEHDSHFDLEHDKQGAFVVAKYGLDDATIKKIRSLGAAHYAKGTKDAQGVKPSDAPSLALAPEDTSLDVNDYLLSQSNLSADSAPTAPLSLDEENMQIAQAARAREEQSLLPSNNLTTEAEKKAAELEGTFKKTSKSPADDEEYFSLVPSSARTFASAPSTEKTPEEVTKAPLEQKAPSGPLPYQLQNQKGMGGGVEGVPALAPTQTQLAGTGLPQDPMKSSENAFEALKQTNLEMGQIEAQRELKNQEAQIKALNNLKDLDDKYQTNLKNIDDEQKRLSNDISNSKIDPNRVYSQMSSGNKMLAAISLVLGGIGQGLLGLRSNPAMDVINDTIDRDIDAQKAALGTKQSLLALNLEKYKRLDAATAATKAQMLTVVQSQMNIAASKANSALAIKNAQLANAKLDMEKAKLNQSLATQSTVSQVLNTQQGIPAEYVMRMPEDIRETLVRVPNGNFYPAISKKAADDANKGLQTVSTIQQIAARSKALFDQGAVLPWDNKAKGLAQSYNSQLNLEIKNLAGLGVLSESDMKIIEGMKPDLTAWSFRDKEQAKLDELNNYINSKVNGFLKQTVPNYSPGNIIEKRVAP